MPQSGARRVPSRRRRKARAHGGEKLSDKIPPQVQEKLDEKGVNIDLDSITPEQLEEIFAMVAEEGPMKIVEVDEENERVEVFFE